jgi:hypothetical protein
VVEEDVRGMNEESEPRTYFYGDEITMRVTFTHGPRLVAIEVLYTHHEDGSYMITLSGNPEPVEGSAVAGEGKRSVVILTGTVDHSIIMGRYLPRRIVAYTLEGRTDFVEPSRAGDWPILYVMHGGGGIRDATVEPEPDV